MFSQLKARLSRSPVLARVAPLFVFALLTYCQGKFGEESRFWVYLAKTIVGAGMLWSLRSFLPEMRWNFSWEAVVVGVAIFAVWVGLDPFYPHLGQPSTGWNPHNTFGENSGLAMLFIGVRFLGSVLVVPPLEEIFYRSFIYRFIIKPEFTSVPLGRFHLGAFLLTSAFFGFSHHEWLAGIICGMAYQWLVFRKGRLGDAITAHAITNLLLGIWIVSKGDWKLW